MCAKVWVCKQCGTGTRSSNELRTGQRSHAHALQPQLNSNGHREDNCCKDDRVAATMDEHVYHGREQSSQNGSCLTPGIRASPYARCQFSVANCSFTMPLEAGICRMNFPNGLLDDLQSIQDEI